MIKIFGIQRTGTTYMRELCKHNFDTIVFTNELGWKHGDVIDPQDNLKKNAHKYSLEMLEAIDKAIKEVCVDVIIVIKSPYTWLQSIQRWARRNWDNGANFTIQQFYDLYNARYENYWINYISPKPIHCYRRFTIVRYEDLLIDYKKVLHRLSAEFELPLLAERNLDKVPQSNTFTKEMRKFYLEEVGDKYISAAVNWRIINNYGYQRKAH